MGIQYKSTSGITYVDINKALEHYGVSREEFKYRLKLGWKLENCIETPSGVTYIVGEPFRDKDGNIFKTVSSAARFHKISIKTVESRLRRGHSIEDALNENFKPRGNKVVVLGVKYDSIKDACRDLGCRYDEAMHLRYKGLSDEEAILNAKEQSKINARAGYTLPDGTTFKGLEGVCKYLGVSSFVVNNQACRENKSIQEILDRHYYDCERKAKARNYIDKKLVLTKSKTPVLKKEYINPVGITCKYIESDLVWSGVSTKVFLDRLCMGWDVKKAIYTPTSEG